MPARQTVTAVSGEIMIKEAKKIFILLFVLHFAFFTGASILGATVFCSAPCCQGSFQGESCHNTVGTADSHSNCHKKVSPETRSGCKADTAANEYFNNNNSTSFTKPLYIHTYLVPAQTYPTDSRQIFSAFTAKRPLTQPLFLKNSTFLL